jgi:putative salt-induced outer membrane protein YdiY
MKHPVAAAALAALALGLAAAPAAADEVVLVGGDRLTGTVVRMTGGKLLIRTAHAAKPLEIDQASVKSVKTDAPVELRLAGGEVIRARLSADQDGRLVAEKGAGRAAVALEWAGIRAINPPPSLWHGSVTVGASDQGGNTDRASASVAAEARRRTARDRFGLRFLYNYAEEEGLMTARNVFAAAKYDWFFSKQVYGYLGEELLSDSFRNLQLRSVTGAGIGWQAFEREDLAVSVETGVAHVNEDFREGPDESRVAARVGASLKYRLLGRVVIADEVTWLPSLEDDQYQLRNEVSLSTPLGAGWNLRLSNVFEYDNDPPEGTGSTDRTWILGLQYTF